MGADLCITYMAIEEDKAPDWQAARRQLAALTDDELRDMGFEIRASKSYAGDPEEDEIATYEVREALASVIDDVAAALEFDGGELALITVPGWMIYLSGGLSWGDEPTDLFRQFEDLLRSGLAEAAGFVDG